MLPSALYILTLKLLVFTPDTQYFIAGGGTWSEGSWLVVSSVLSRGHIRPTARSATVSGNVRQQTEEWSWPVNHEEQ